MRKLNGKYATRKQAFSERVKPLFILSIFISFSWGVSLSPEIHKHIQASAMTLTVKESTEGEANNATLDRTAQAETTTSPSTPPVIEYVREENIDTWIDDAAKLHFPSPQYQSEVKMIMHCLLHRESTHGENDGQGDNGMAYGILQYWMGTWTGYRKEMIKEGFATEIGTPLNDKDAIYTTVWALKTHRGQAWGPIYRELTQYKYSNKPGCPVPSWDK